MLLDPAELPERDVYRFMISAVVPRPIAFVSSIGTHGHNLAPFSYFIPISSAPPLLGISINLRAGDPKDTVANIRKTGDFVINIVTEELAERMVKTSGEWPPHMDEFQVAGLTPIPSLRVKSPSLKESPIHLECRLDRAIALGNTEFVIGEMLCAVVDDAVLTDGRVDIDKLRPVGRLGGDGYSIVRDVLNLPRPRVDRLTGAPLPPRPPGDGRPAGSSGGS
jgi:flavin reductase (DIM6/NTAB) family NADH-FMN oxidoreductase RutF